MERILIAQVVAWARDLELSGVPTYCTPVAWAEVYAWIRPGEQPITQEFFDADAVVASAAATAGLHLWTLNRKHYPMPDVRFYEP